MITRLNKMIHLLRRGSLAVALAAVASAQGTPPGETVSISDPRPLAKAAEALMARYGVPVSYEDVSTYAYSGDLASPGTPRTSGLQFVAEPFQLVINPAQRFQPVQPAQPASVAKMLQSILDQHESNGNPGRFKLLETAAGLVIVPTATRSSGGVFVPDQSILDLRISFPPTASMYTFATALRTASGKQFSVDDFGTIYSGQISANNEVARDVLARWVNGLHRVLGVHSIDGLDPESTYAWRLTTVPGVDGALGGAYRMDLLKVIVESRDATGNVVGVAVTRGSTPAPPR